MGSCALQLFHPFRRIKDRHRKRTAQVLAYAVSGSADKVWKGDPLVMSTMEKLEEVSEVPTTTSITQHRV